MSALIAGIGNPFFGDDGFGVEVARELAEGELPASARLIEPDRAVEMIKEILARGDPPS